MSKIPLLVALLSLLFSCRPGGGPAPGRPDGKTLQRVNGTPVTDRQFKLEFATVPDYARGQYEGSSGARRFLDELVDRELLYQEALRRGLDNDPEFTAAVESFRRARLAELLVRREALKRDDVLEDELRAYYDGNKDNFTVPAKVHAAHILVGTEKEALAVLKALRDGADFASLARRLSTDTDTRDKGGDLGTFSPGRMVAAFDEAVFALKPGDVSRPVRTEFGYHIIKVLERREPETVAYEQVRAFLREQMLREKKQSVYGDLIAGLRKKATLSEVDTGTLESLAKEKATP